MPYSLREVLRCVLEGLRGLDRNLAIATKGAISRARTRLGWKALAEVALAEELLPTLTKDMLLIEDRGYNDPRPGNGPRAGAGGSLPRALGSSESV